MFDFFKQLPEVRTVVSEKKDGSMKVFPERPEENSENRKEFFSGQGIVPDRVVSADIVHGVKVGIITSQDVSHNGRSSLIRHNDGTMILGTDALVTKEKNLFLSVTVADCLPIFLYDPVAEVIGIAHAGWRGIVDGVIGKTLEAMVGCGARQENIFVAFGPSIQKCHFEIGVDILSRFSKYEEFVVRKNGKISVDLQGIAMEQLRGVGVPEKNIETTTLCTFCEKEKFFSYRRDKPEKIEAMVAVIGMK